MSGELVFVQSFSHFSGLGAQTCSERGTIVGVTDESVFGADAFDFVAQVQWT